MPTNHAQIREEWINDFMKIGAGTGRFMASRQEVIEFIRDLLAARDREMEGKIEQIRNLTNKWAAAPVDKDVALLIIEIANKTIEEILNILTKGDE